LLALFGSSAFLHAAVSTKMAINAQLKNFLISKIPFHKFFLGKTLDDSLEPLKLQLATRPQRSLATELSEGSERFVSHRGHRECRV